MSNVIPFIKPKRVCSFCKTPEDKVKHLIEGVAGKTICDQCIRHAAKRIKESDEIQQA